MGNVLVGIKWLPLLSYAYPLASSLELWYLPCSALDELFSVTKIQLQCLIMNRNDASCSVLLHQKIWVSNLKSLQMLWEMLHKLLSILSSLKPINNKAAKAQSICPPFIDFPECAHMAKTIIARTEPLTSWSLDYHTDLQTTASSRKWGRAKVQPSSRDATIWWCRFIFIAKKLQLRFEIELQ